MRQFISDMNQNIKRLPKKEAMLGKGLIQPFVDCNSGSRKLMFSLNVEQSLPLVHPEVPFIMTGYEQEYGDRSSSIIVADDDYEVVGKICKFSDNPQHDYFLILRSMTNNKLSFIERKEYMYSTETYGYAYNTEVLDSLDISYEIPKGMMLRKSTAYDDVMNREDTVNLLTTYVSTDITMEDEIWLSETAREKLTSRLYKKVVVNLNDNDILLNLFGDTNTIKSFPMIGEYIQNGILCAVRREKTEESLFAQSVEMLQRILISDEKYTPGNGQVIDIDIRCNNSDMLRDRFSNSQVLYYYNDHIRFISEFVNCIDMLMDRYHITVRDIDYHLGKMYYNFKEELSGTQFRERKVYSGTQIEFMVKELNIPSTGDKISNRYGGKGVIAKITPDDEMPRIMLTGEPIEAVVNSSSCPNRENPGQWHELSLTHVGKCIVDITKLGYFTTNEALQEIIKLLSFCSPLEAEEMADRINSFSEEDKDIYLQTIIDSGNIVMSILPMTESMSLDTLSELYDAFPYITQRKMLVPIESSTGKLRFAPARRPGVVGHIAMYRLEQYAKEKHSVTSLSSTNLRNENCRNKANKFYKATHQSTPVNFGDMESGDMGHLGFEHVITLLMIHSVSPHGRRLVEQIFTGDPYMVNIELDKDSSNRSAEILAAYLKAIGYRLRFYKIKRARIKPFMIKPFFRGGRQPIKPFIRLDENQCIQDINKYIDWIAECTDKKNTHPIQYRPISYDD